ncbi:DEAD/DEAH box helicase [Paraliomyxa miuraensis]|uniref:DEAD/DEAH box helicase n=1 Tax=Paraliomyxa miuraensis TaxID=376150 RepID=UPI0022581ACF|nr:DEAD/DEAH box helicase [Paraliomyxa miuraensis]MCX4246278.1 DEAD/DEAH box helicase [Paraliomyxa miuraensis]
MAEGSSSSSSGFDELGLSASILRAVREAGYVQPTPIQRDAIPPVLAGRDLLGCAQTGTGKTAAFALPLLQLLDARVGDDPCVRALVLTPTRELAAQIGESLSTYGRHLELWHTVIFGGVSEGPQIQELRRGIDVLVATPGRLLDLLGRKQVNLDRVEVLVLDEADRMLDMGFLPDVRRVVQALPRRQQTLLFSATMPEEIRRLAQGLLRDPVSVATARISSPVESVEQQVYFVDKVNKRRLLLDLLGDVAKRRTLVFSRTKHGANRIAKLLDDHGIRASAIHGNKSQGARTRALEGFRRGELAVLVATDLAARGLDVDGITHVINFDLPNEPETYVHRIGRTGRAGATGVALSMCDHEERDYLRDIESLIGRRIEAVDDHAYPPSGQPPAPAVAPRPRAGGGRAPAGPARRGSGRPGRGRRRGGRRSPS